MTVYLGIDPGFKGACWAINGETLDCAHIDMPTIETGGAGKKKRREIDCSALHAWLRDLSDKPQPLWCALERVSAMPGQGVTSMFNFGQGYGALKMALAANEISYTLVSPVSWKREMGCTKDKGASRMRASQLLPAYASHFQRVKDEGRAEAALIAMYAMRLYAAPEIDRAVSGEPVDA